MSKYQITEEANGRFLVTFFHPEREPHSVSFKTYAKAYDAAESYVLS